MILIILYKRESRLRHYVLYLIKHSICETLHVNKVNPDSRYRPSEG